MNSILPLTCADKELYVFVKPSVLTLSYYYHPDIHLMHTVYQHRVRPLNSLSSNKIFQLKGPL